MVRLPIRLRSPLRPRHAALLPQNGHDPISGARNEMLRMRYALVMTCRARASIYEADGDAFLTRRARRRRLPRAAAVVVRRTPARVVEGAPTAPTTSLTPAIVSDIVARTERLAADPIRSAASIAPCAALRTRWPTSAPSARAASAVPSTALRATLPTSPPRSPVALTAPRVADFATRP